MRTDHKSRQYTKFPFGKHKGVYIKDIPDDYLNWCSKNLVSEEFRYTILQLVIEEIEYRHFNKKEK